jgi:hypothetical protein
MKQRAKTKTGNEKNPRELRPSYELKAGFGRREQLDRQAPKKKCSDLAHHREKMNNTKQDVKTNIFFIAIQT